MPKMNVIPAGTQFTSTKGVVVEVVEYRGAKDVLVRRVSDNHEFVAFAHNLRRGLVTGAKGSGLYQGVLPDNMRWIPDYEGMYAIATDGFVWSGKSSKLIKMACPPMPGRKQDGTGYRTVCLTHNGVQENFYCHRLVAEAFIPNPEGKPCVNHKDGDKTNADVSNLEWCTSSENSQHAVDTGLHTGVDFAKWVNDGRYDGKLRRALATHRATREDRAIFARMTDEQITNRGFDCKAVRGLRANPRLTKYSTEKLIELAKVMTLTDIAMLTGYTLSAVSRRISRHKAKKMK